METYAKGHVYKRGRVWWMSFKAQGKRIRESAETTNKAVAERLLTKRLDDIDRGTYTHIQKSDDTWFTDFAERYLDVYAKQSPVWRKNKECAFAPLKVFFGNRPLSQITQALIADYRAKRLKESIKTSRKTPLPENAVRKLIQPPTVNREIATLNALFVKAIEENIITVNPCRNVKRYTEKDRIRKRILKPFELAKLLEHCDHPLRELVLFATLTAMRSGEIQSLRWTDIDQEEGLITILKTKNGETRTLPITEPISGILSDLRKYHAKMRQKFASVKKNWPDDGLLFPSAKAPEKKYSFKKAFGTAVTRAGLNQKGLDVTQRFVFHSLRHTALSNLGMAGVDLKTVMEIAGHKSPEMSMRYTKLHKEHVAKAMDKVQANISTGTICGTIDDSPIQPEVVSIGK